MPKSFIIQKSKQEYKHVNIKFSKMRHGQFIRQGHLSELILYVSFDN